MAVVSEMKERVITTLVAYSIICKMHTSPGWVFELGFDGEIRVHMYFLQDDHPAMCQCEILPRIYFLTPREMDDFGMIVQVTRAIGVLQAPNRKSQSSIPIAAAPIVSGKGGR